MDRGSNAPSAQLTSGRIAAAAKAFHGGSRFQFRKLTVRHIDKVSCVLFSAKICIPAPLTPMPGASQRSTRTCRRRFGMSAPQRACCGNIRGHLKYRPRVTVDVSAYYTQDPDSMSSRRPISITATANPTLSTKLTSVHASRFLFLCGLSGRCHITIACPIRPSGISPRSSVRDRYSIHIILDVRFGGCASFE